MPIRQWGTVTLALSSGSIASGGSTTTSSAGLATFSGVTIDTALLFRHMSATSGTLTANRRFQYLQRDGPGKGRRQPADTAADTGSGVQKVTYYYCPGYSGSCTSTNWTLIGTSTTATTWAYSWATAAQPADGAYEVVAVGTDNVGNVSGSSTSVPVTVNN